MAWQLSYIKTKASNFWIPKVQSKRLDTIFLDHPPKKSDPVLVLLELNDFKLKLTFKIEN